MSWGTCRIEHPYLFCQPASNPTIEVRAYLPANGPYGLGRGMPLRRAGLEWLPDSGKQDNGLLVLMDTGSLPAYSIWCLDHEQTVRWRYDLSWPGMRPFVRQAPENQKRRRILAGYDCINECGQLLWQVSDIKWLHEAPWDLAVSPPETGGILIYACGKSGALLVNPDTGSVIRRCHTGPCQSVAVWPDIFAGDDMPAYLAACYVQSYANWSIGTISCLNASGDVLNILEFPMRVTAVKPLNWLGEPLLGVISPDPGRSGLYTLTGTLRLPGEFM